MHATFFKTKPRMIMCLLCRPAHTFILGKALYELIHKQSTLPVAHFVMTCGGCLYQELLKGCFIEASSHVSPSTLMVFPCSSLLTLSCGHFLMLINELPYSMRYIFLSYIRPLRVLKENRIFTGLWYGSKPNMSLFLKPLARSLQSLSKDGNWQLQ